ncbi:hypothetical protein H9P43_006123 [Blastocladiella emersonii ATCC 22665]|nr:hypothetical protein H9P43_006123 [Blastocladiella emersonii ATCC 22665]
MSFRLLLSVLGGLAVAAVWPLLFVGQRTELIAIPASVVAALVALNLWLAYRSKASEVAMAKRQTPTLRILYAICLIALVQAVCLMVPQITPSTRSLVFAVTTLVLVATICKLYVLQQLYPDSEESSSGWMGTTRVGILSSFSSQVASTASSNRAPGSFHRDFSTSSDRTSTSLTTGDTAVHVAASTFLIELTPCVPCQPQLFVDQAVLIATEILGNPQYRAAIALRSLTAVDFVPGSQTCLRLRLRGHVVDIVGSMATTATIAQWKHVLGDFAYFDEWTVVSGIQVQVDVPRVQDDLTTTEYFSLIKAMEDHKVAYYDIVFVDVIWPALLTNVLAPLNGLVSPAAIDAQEQSFVDAARIGGKIYALPYTAPMSLLYYRADILADYGYTSAPRTWDEMEAMLDRILPREQARRPGLHGYIGQLKAYEGLTCNAVEWLGSYGAGTAVELDGSISTTNVTRRDATVAAMTRFRSWVTRGFIQPSVLTMAESPAYAAWLSGNALFMRNWFVGSYLTGLNFTPGIAPLPGNTPNLAGFATNGANYFGINRFTADPIRAAKVLEFITGTESQRKWATTLGRIPTIKSLLQDQSICNVLGNCNISGKLQIVARPALATGKSYLTVSEAIFSGWNLALSGYLTPAAAVTWLTRRLAAILSVDILGPPLVVQWTDPAGIVTIVAFVVSKVVIIASTIALVRQKRSALARRMSFRLLLTVLAGLAVTAVWPLLFIGPRTGLQCFLQIAILALAWAVILASMAVQDLRVYLIVSSPLRRVASDVTRVLRVFIFVVILLQCLGLLLWGLVSPPSTAMYVVADEWEYLACSEGTTPELLAIPAAVVAALVTLNMWLAYRAKANEVAMAKQQTPTLRILYVICLVALILAVCLMVPQITPSARSLIFAVTTLVLVVTVCKMYVLEQLYPDSEESTTGWMGMTRAGTESSLSTDIATTASGSRLGSARRGTSSSIDRKSSFSITTHEMALRTAASTFLVEITPCVPCQLRLFLDQAVLIATEISGSPRYRAAIALRTLTAVDFVTPSQTCLRLQLRGRVVDIVGSAATSRVLAQWKQVLSEFVREDPGR